jgi:hypothetical protein
VCWEKQQHSSIGWNIGTWALILVGGIALVLLAPGPSMGWMFINLTCFRLFNVLTIIPHELGHAFVARTLGLRVFRIIIGTGRPWFRTRMFGFDTEFKTLFLGGATVAAHRCVARYRRRQFLFVIGGPAVNLALAGATLLAMQPGEIWGLARLCEGFAPLQVFLYANVVVLLANLWPRTIQTALGNLPSDGKLLFRATFPRAGDAANNHAILFAMEGMACRERNDFHGARRWVEDGLAIYPDNETLRDIHGLNMIETGDLTAARDLLLLRLPRQDLAPVIRALLLNNIAYVDALMENEELLDEADRYSTEALASLPWMSAVRGTRGTVLLALGRIDEAIPLLRKSLEQTTEPHGKAQNACFLAMAKSRQGDTRMAADYLKLACDCDPKCFLLERANLEVGKLLTT